jgi:hypothetical protein
MLIRAPDEDRPMTSFTVKMRITELREYSIEANNADEAVLKAESGEVFKEDYAHCHTLDWDVCEITRADDQALSAQ